MDDNPYRYSDIEVATPRLNRRTSLVFAALVFCGLLAIAFLQIPFWVQLANALLGFIDWWYVWFSLPIPLRPVVQTFPTIPAIAYGAYQFVRVLRDQATSFRSVASVFFVVYAIVLAVFVMSWWPYL
jgi:hypothetical protein